MNDFMKSRFFGLLIIAVVAAMVGGCLYVGLTYAPLAGAVEFFLRMVGAWAVGAFIGDIIGERIAKYQESL